MRLTLSLARFVAVSFAATMTGACGDDGKPETSGFGQTSTSSESDGSTTTPTTGEPTTTMSASTTSTSTSTTTTPTTTESVTPTDGTATTSSSSGETTTDETTSTATTDETMGTTGTEECGAPGILLVCDDGDDTDPFHAIGVGCAGAPENTIPIADQVFMSQPIAWRAARGFGSAEDPNAPGELLFRPREGEKFLVLSTGRVANLQPDGVLLETQSQYDNDNNFNPDMPNELPAPMSPLVGSNGGQGGTPFEGCDGQHDCSDSIAPNWALGQGDPNDVLFGSFAVQVPPGVDGFLFDAVFFSSEYPEFVDDPFNDMFIGWSTSEAYTGNVTFFDGQPFTVTSLAEAMANAGYVADAPELAGTGFEGHGTTGWVTIQAQVVPGETFTFAFATMDMGDSSKATVTVVDHWRWDCKGCVPLEVDPLCGTEGHPKCCGLCVDVLDDPLCGTEGHPACCTAG
ncbi:choice-of-anchor L domain-containing protein [Nannocystis radixulma]|uniref:Choice-of-anchor L domain-containing protein n=1 Tax=Nannocystis radixulma TaxID=2995305 RepID=A0ABT5BNF5_9BACT|nr:choice-of-anchor L domain-containing protein [Nannocystis radixulma]MDC0675213.1 choice-of-anchor L domain-containing protein [Nannocystis radixulma]